MDLEVPLSKCSKETEDITLNHEDTLEFISLYESLPILWDTKHPNHRVRSARLQAFHKVSVQMGKNWTVDQVDRKIQSLRAGYNKVRRRQSGHHKESGQRHCQAKAKDRWSYYDRIHSFLASVEGRSPRVVARTTVPASASPSNSSSEPGEPCEETFPLELLQSCEPASPSSDTSVESVESLSMDPSVDSSMSAGTPAELVPVALNVSAATPAESVPVAPSVSAAPVPVTVFASPPHSTSASPPHSTSASPAPQHVPTPSASVVPQVRERRAGMEPVVQVGALPTEELASGQHRQHQQQEQQQQQHQQHQQQQQQQQYQQHQQQQQQHQQQQHQQQEQQQQQQQHQQQQQPSFQAWATYAAERLSSMRDQRQAKRLRLHFDRMLLEAEMDMEEGD